MKRIAIILPCLLVVTLAHAASFDCAKAGTKVEHIICDNPDISKLDETLNAKYHQALLRRDIKDKVIKSQLAWLKNVRNICKTTACVKKAYETRIKELGLTSSFGLVFMAVPPGTKLPVTETPKAAAAPIAPTQETKKPVVIPHAEPDEYKSLDSRCPDNLGASRKYDIYNDSWITFVQDRTLGLGLSDKAITLVDNAKAELKLAKLCNGNVVAAWVGERPGSRWQNLTVKIYDSQFNPLTGEFRVDENKSSKAESNQSVAPLKNGGFVVTWRTDAGTAENVLTTHIHARIFDSNGKPISSVIDISADNQPKQTAKAYGLPNGGFAVVWGIAGSVILKYFDANGKPRSDAIHMMNDTNWVDDYGATSYGYVARDGSLNLFVPKENAYVYGFPIFGSARSYNMDGVPQSGILKPDELKNLPGYELMKEKFIRNKALRLGNHLRGFSSHAKGNQPKCGLRYGLGYDGPWVDKLLRVSHDPEVLSLMKRIGNAFAPCP